MGDMADWVNEAGGYGHYYWPKEIKMPSIICRTCGERGLYWRQLPEGYRLFKNGKQHNCKETILKRLIK